MAAGEQYSDRYAALTSAIRGWDRRARTGQSLLWLPRALIAAVAVGIGLAVISRLRPFMLPETIALITVGALVFAVLVSLTVIWLTRRDPRRLALRYDILLGSQERVTTALELIEGRISADPELIERQLTSANLWVSQADARRAIPLRAEGRALLLLIGAAAVLVLLLVLPNPQLAALTAHAAQDAAIDAAEEDLRELTQDIAADPELDDPEREALLETLENARDTLAREDVSPEEAFAALSDVETELSRRAQDLLQRSAATQAALNAAAGRLSDAMSQSPGGETGGQNLEQMLEQLADQMELMDQLQQQNAANAFQQAANSMFGSNPGLANQLQQAADQLQQGNTSAAQQSAQQAAQQAQQAQQQAQQQQEQGERAQDQANQANQSAQQVARQSSEQAQSQAGEESQQNQQPQAQESTQGEQQQGAQTNQQGEQSGAQNQQGAQSQQGAGEQPGDEGAAGSGEQQGAQSQSESQSNSQSSSGNQQQGANDPSQAAQPGAGSGSGDQAADPSTQAGAFSGDQVDPNNNPDGGGLSQYAPIYAPERIGGQSGSDDQLFLEPDSSNVPSVEGNFSENPTGQSVVPYNQVFSDYRAAMNQALNRNYIPLAMRDLVQNYFSSLEPSQQNP